MRFLYQEVLEVIDLTKDRPPEPTGLFAPIVKGWRTLKEKLRIGSDFVSTHFAPGPGEKIIYSHSAPGVAYRVKTTEVTDEAHLIELMGGADTLTNGQKALLEAFRAGSSPAVTAMNACAYKKEVTTTLSDLSTIKNPPDAMERDFWPMSLGSIQMSSSHFEGEASGEAARLTFLHEYAHTLDRTIPGGLPAVAIANMIQRRGVLYGPDFAHSTTECLSPQMAFSEGWAEFHVLLDQPKLVADFENRVKKIRYEGRSGDYTTKETADEGVPGTDLLKMEGNVALLLYRLTQNLDNGREKVYTAFRKSNLAGHDTRMLLRMLVQDNRSDAATIARELDAITLGKLSDEEFQIMLGYFPEIQAFLKERGKEADNNPTLDPEAGETPIDDTTGTSDVAVDLPVTNESGSTNPFSE